MTMTLPRSTTTPYFRLNGIPSDPTDVASGTSPVTAGDISYAAELMLKLPRHLLVYLTVGSALDPHGCNVCAVLRDCPERVRVPEVREAINALLKWHGADGLRCGVIYGIAAGLTCPPMPQTDQTANAKRKSG